MTAEQKLSIIESGKEYFRKIIIPSHIRNLERYCSCKADA